MPDSSSTSVTDQRKCSVKSCGHTIAIAECRKMCGRCRNTQAEQSRKKRQRKREREDAEGTLIKRRAPSKPKPPLYRIPNVGLFTERDWPHLDERLFPKPPVQSEPLQPVDYSPPLMRSDGYARTVPPAKDEGAKELVAVRICNIKACYQPVPVEHKLACVDCHERKTSYLLERKRKQDLEAANEATWTIEDPTLRGYCSVIQFDNDPSVQHPSSHASASNTARFPGTQTADMPSILTPIDHPPTSNEEVFHAIPANVSPTHAPIHLPPVSNEETRPGTVGNSLTQAQPHPSSAEKSAPTEHFEIFRADLFSSFTPQHQVFFEKNQTPNTAPDHIITISPTCNDGDVDMEPAKDGEEEEKTEWEQWRLDRLLLKACADGDEAKVKRLLDDGSNVNALLKVYLWDMGSGNALEIASFFGFKSVVQLLLDSGADINAEGGDYHNALQAASYSGRNSVVELLLDHGADINADGGDYGSALQAASYCGHVSVVNFLLHHGADVNAQGGRYGNALQAASYGGHELVVNFLLDHGADVNAQGGRYGNALQAASYGGHELVVNFLLDHGADVNAQGGAYGNALQAACTNDQEPLVKLLLNSGAKINAQGGDYGNALEAASYWGYESVVKLLLEHGADINAQGGEYGNALQAASYRGREAAVKLLLEHGADINAQGGEYGNALQAASYRGREAVVKLLLDHGAYVNAQGGKYGNALRAARNGHWRSYKEVAQLLLSRGAIDLDL